MPTSQACVVRSALVPVRCVPSMCYASSNQSKVIPTIVSGRIVLALELSCVFTSGFMRLRRAETRLAKDS